MDENPLAGSTGANAPESALAGAGGGTARRKPWLAAVLSWLVPGLGHFYVRRFQRGLAWLVVDVIAVLAVGNLPVLQAFSSFDWTFSLVAGLDAFFVARRLNDGEIEPENLDQRKWLIPVAAVFALAYVSMIAIALNDVVTDTRGEVRFGRAVLDDENLSLVGEARQFTAGSPMAFRAQLREVAPRGSTLVVDVIRVSGSEQTVIDSRTEVLDGDADLYSLRDWIPSTQSGTYRVRITQGGRLQATGTFTLTRP